jgi:hypothetical protein
MNHKISLTKESEIIIKCCDLDHKLLKLINYIKEIGNVGHSFDIVVDPKNDTKKTFGWDGDGWDKIKSVTIEDLEQKNQRKSVTDLIRKTMGKIKSL